MILVKKLLDKQFVRFVAVGGFAALVNFLSRIALSYYFHYVVAIILAYCLGMLTAFILCRMMVFTPQRNTHTHQILYFIGINGIAVLQTIVISLLFAKYFLLGIPDIALRETIAHFIGVCFPVFTSYLGHKYLTFR